MDRMIESKSKTAIAKILDNLNIEYDDLTGYAIEKLKDEKYLAVTRRSKVKGRPRIFVTWI